jgi:hypothetical protein
MDARIVFDNRRRTEGTAPQVSIIIPVYNVENYIRECLISVLGCAALVDLEIILIDDGSVDASAELIAGLLHSHTFPDTVFMQQENRGLSAVRNLGATLARGEYIGFLDSDDFILPWGFKKLIEYADSHECDCVFGRTLVFDNRNHGMKPFNDWPIWEKLLEGADNRVIEAGEAPWVFALEPGANYRLTRRGFYLENRITFPEGLLFEDSPAHFRMVGSARRIGMVDVPYYWYRVNHPGKITNEKTDRRFEILEVVRQSLATLKECGVNPEQGGAALYGLFRLAWWCGTMVRPERRRELFGKACELWASEVPEAWGRAYLRQTASDERHFLLGAFFLRGEAGRLESFSYNRNQVLAPMLFLLRLGRPDLLIRYGLQRMRGILGRRLPRIPGRRQGCEG